MSPWLSVWGLIADMVGVAIITYDVWPDYKLHRLRETIGWQYKVLVSALAEKHRDDGVGQTVQEMLHDMDRGMMDRLRHRLKLPPIAEGRRLPTKEELDRSQKETDAAISHRMEALETRSRPPVGVGLVFVLIGFALQLLGALPPAFVQAHLGG